MTERVEHSGLKVAKVLSDFISNEAIPGTGLTIEDFWLSFNRILEEFSLINKDLLEKRKVYQAAINHWHEEHRGNFDPASYKSFLKDIGYLSTDIPDFKITTDNVDDEIAIQAGPQLVVPLSNARYAINACNARWGSLYDALYGTDAILPISQNSGYDPTRGEKVIAFAKQFLDEIMPLKEGKYEDVCKFKINKSHLYCILNNGDVTQLKDESIWLGYSGKEDNPVSLLFSHNDLHIDIHIDPAGNIGSTDTASIQDIILESAITTIQDCEDSVAAVDAEDKVGVYRHWLGLMKGTLTASFNKNGKTQTRTMAIDKHYISKNGNQFTLPGRSLMLVRNVGLLMYSDAILDVNDKPIPEGIMDAMITVLCGLHDINNDTQCTNSACGNIYIVKPKLHGPEEVHYTCEMLCAIEDALGLVRNTLKLGIMDEERRTTVNLKQCIYQAKDRIIFINTGFLDRTGDEIHTSMSAGPFVEKTHMKQQTWINSYEDWNVERGIQSGFPGVAQIGKGMWAMPDNMADMLKQKIAHPKAGASTAWVPSPTAAVLHAIHYHQVNVKERQKAILKNVPAKLDDILLIPLMNHSTSLDKQAVQRELDNNIQGILGYVVRWVDQGVGCSKVPDIDNIGLMEDRATLRISSQHVANWLKHEICSSEEVNESLRRMAKIVDEQNANDPDYESMSANYNESIAFKAASDLIFKGEELPNGYTEPVLHAMRLKKKSMKS